MICALGEVADACRRSLESCDLAQEAISVAIWNREADAKLSFCIMHEASHLRQNSKARPLSHATAKAACCYLLAIGFSTSLEYPESGLCRYYCAGTASPPEPIS